jgi:hypothetical protein
MSLWQPGGLKRFLMRSINENATRRVAEKPNSAFARHAGGYSPVSTAWDSGREALASEIGANGLSGDLCNPRMRARAWKAGTPGNRVLPPHGEAASPRLGQVRTCRFGEASGQRDGKQNPALICWIRRVRATSWLIMWM